MPPTFDRSSRFESDWDQLTRQQRARFQTKVLRQLVPALNAGGNLPPGLRIKRVLGTGKIAVFEMTWAPDGRATFEYGPPVLEGEPHIIWRRIGTHAILDSP